MEDNLRAGDDIFSPVKERFKELDIARHRINLLNRDNFQVLKTSLYAIIENNDPLDKEIILSILNDYNDKD